MAGGNGEGDGELAGCIETRLLTLVFLSLQVKSPLPQPRISYLIKVIRRLTMNLKVLLQPILLAKHLFYSLSILEV